MVSTKQDARSVLFLSADYEQHRTHPDAFRRPCLHADLGRCSPSRPFAQRSCRVRIYICSLSSMITERKSRCRNIDSAGIHSPFSQIPALKKAHIIVFGSTPNGTFGCVIAVWNRAASSFFLLSSASFCFAFNSFSFSFARASGFLPVWARDNCCCCATCLAFFPPLLAIPKVCRQGRDQLDSSSLVQSMNETHTLSTTTLFFGAFCCCFFGGILQ